MGMFLSSGLLLGEDFEWNVLFKTLCDKNCSIADFVMLGLTCKLARIWLRIYMSKCRPDHVFRDTPQYILGWIERMKKTGNQFGGRKTRTVPFKPEPGHLLWIKKRNQGQDSCGWLLRIGIFEVQRVLNGRAADGRWLCSWDVTNEPPPTRVDFDEGFAVYRMFDEQIKYIFRDKFTPVTEDEQQMMKRARTEKEV